MANSCDLAIIGGGAAGLCAAIAAARLIDGAGVKILERCDRVGKKLLATGNGRCNLTNKEASVSHYRGDRDFIESVLRRFDAEHTLAFFESLGVRCKSEEAGRVYPFSDQASSVLDVMRLECAQLGVEEICNSEIATLRSKENGFLLIAREGAVLHAKRVIVAAGGCASPSLGSNGSGYSLLTDLGHVLTSTYPALVQIKTETEEIRSLKGIRFTGGASVSVAGEILRHECGEVLFTEYGLSGIAIFELSGIAGAAFAAGERDVEIILDLMDGISEKDLAKELFARAQNLSQRPLEHFLTGLLNKRIALCVFKKAAVPVSERFCSDLSPAELRRIASVIKGWRIKALSNLGFNHAQVTAGGIETLGFDPLTLASKKAPGVYAAGEVLDVDGDCGGFNLQWAWASGHIAGEAAALSLL